MQVKKASRTLPVFEATNGESYMAKSIRDYKRYVHDGALVILKSAGKQPGTGWEMFKILNGK